MEFFYLNTKIDKVVINKYIYRISILNNILLGILKNKIYYCAK